MSKGHRRPDATFGIQRDNYPIDEGGFVPRQMVLDAARGAMPFPFSF